MADNERHSCEFFTDHLQTRLEVTIPADIDSVSTVTDRIMRIVVEMQCAEGREFEIETSLREALANAVIHGAGGDPTKSIQCTVACDPERGMLIVVRDPGTGFDPQSIPSPVQGQNLFFTHGRGIYLITQLMDEVRFEKGGTEIHMVKR
jgi:serine/threonine-protein kinase RsbW